MKQGGDKRKWVLLCQLMEDSFMLQTILQAGFDESFYIKTSEHERENISQRSEITAKLSITAATVHRGRSPPSFVPALQTPPSPRLEQMFIFREAWELVRRLGYSSNAFTHRNRDWWRRREGGGSLLARCNTSPLCSPPPPIDLPKDLGQRSALLRSRGQTSSHEYGRAPLSGDHLVKLIGIQTNNPAERGHIRSITVDFLGHKCLLLPVQHNGRWNLDYIRYTIRRLGANISVRFFHPLFSHFFILTI